MSRAAYENFFRKAAPPGALFGTDMSWFQSYGDYGTTLGYWQDVGRWADFVCIRYSFGSNGDDGAQDLHWQCANDVGYSKQRGAYHFVHVNGGLQANFDNFMSRTAHHVDMLDFYMLDYEETPVASGDWIKQMCDMVEQARGKPVSNYAGRFYANQSGNMQCPVSQYWIPQYPGHTGDAWEVNGTPDMPDQYYGVLPGCWQWQSETPEHGHLDLNISETPGMFGGTAGGPDLDANQAAQLDTLFHIAMDDNGRWGKLWNAADKIEQTFGPIQRIAAIVERFNTDSYVRSTGHDANNPGNSLNIYDELRKFMKSPATSIDVVALAKELAPYLPDNVDEKLLADSLFQMFAAKVGS